MIFNIGKRVCIFNTLFQNELVYVSIYKWLIKFSKLLRPTVSALLGKWLKSFSQLDCLAGEVDLFHGQHVACELRVERACPRKNYLLWMRECRTYQVCFFLLYNSTPPLGKLNRSHPAHHCSSWKHLCGCAGKGSTDISTQRVSPWRPLGHVTQQQRLSLPRTQIAD